MRKLWPPNINAKSKLPQLICDRVWVIIVVKNPPASAGDLGDAGSISGSGRFPGVGNGNPLQYSFLENPMDRGAWQAAVHGVTKSRTRLSTQYNSLRAPSCCWELLSFTALPAQGWATWDPDILLAGLCLHCVGADFSEIKWEIHSHVL